MVDEKLIKQCIQYFKSNLGFSRVLIEIRDKYKSLGKIGGSVKIDNLTLEEQEALTGFLKENCFKNSISISLRKFQKAIDDTVFNGIDLLQILELYFEKDLMTKREELEIYRKDKNKFFHKILVENGETVGSKWLKDIIHNKTNAWRIISQRYDHNKKKLKKDLNITIKAIDNLPYLDKRIERLALFASKISKNPHAFDEIEDSGKFLLYGISYLLKSKYPKTSEEKAEMLFKVGIIKDGISNFSISSGLLAFKDGEIHTGWQGFYNSYEPLQISLWNLSKVDKIISGKDKVFIFENPTVFSEILDILVKIKPSIVCTYGQVKLASLILLDNLVENGAHLHYSGDFDPEGLIIADKLKSRYGQNLTLWRYNADDYYNSISKNKISQARINKLHNLKDKTLIQMGEMIKENKYAGYQESIIGDLISDIKKINL